MSRRGKHLFTSESVTEGHPDKISDQISDAVLDQVLEQEPHGRVACETLVTTGLVIIAGEITTKGDVDFPAVAREVIRDVGYTRAKYGFDCETCGVISSIDRQSPDIAQGVDTGGAGDQGLMFGYACSETPQLMPMPIVLAHELVKRLAQCRKQGIVDWLRPDGKSQVTVEYEGDKPIRVDAVVIAAQHSSQVTNDEIAETIQEKSDQARHSQRITRQGHQVSHQSYRSFRNRRASGRLWCDGTQDHCRYLWWRRQPWRRSFFR